MLLFIFRNIADTIACSNVIYAFSLSLVMNRDTVQSAGSNAFQIFSNVFCLTILEKYAPTFLYISNVVFFIIFDQYCLLPHCFPLLLI